MTVTAQTIIDRVRTQLIDEDAVRWTDAELLRWLSDGQRAVVAFSAGASSTTAVKAMVAGTRQSIPADGHMLLTIVRNLSADQVTAGRACRIVSREILDAQDSNWHNAAQSATVLNYIFDPQEPTHFYVYPPNNGAGSVEMVYAVKPGEIASLSTALVVQEIYQTALIDYVMYRAHQKDSDYAAGQQVALGYYQAFLTYMGQGEGSQLSSNPNLQMAPPEPTARGSAK